MATMRSTRHAHAEGDDASRTDREVDVNERQANKEQYVWKKVTKIALVQDMPKLMSLRELC